MIHLLHHQNDKKILFCTYKKKNLPIGFIDNGLAKNVAKRIPCDYHKTNVRLKIRDLTPINSEEFIFDDDTNEKLRCLSRDINSSIILDKDTKNGNSESWKIKSIDEKSFYAFPFNERYNGIAICHDIDDKYIHIEKEKEEDINFYKKILALKAIVISFDSPTISKLNRLFKEK